MKKLYELLAKRTEKSALALRRLAGPVTLTQESPEVGRPYFRASCRIDAMNLLVQENGSNSSRWWTRLQPIRTAGEVELEFVVFTREAFCWQRIRDEARRMAMLGMSGRAIGRALRDTQMKGRRAEHGLRERPWSAHGVRVI